MERQSFYFFDIDENILHLPTRIHLLNTMTGEERAMRQHEYEDIKAYLGVPGLWEDWADPPARAYREFADGKDRNGEEYLLRDVKRAMDSANWRGPSWEIFKYAVLKRRPVAIVTARQHSRETIKAALKLIVDAGHLPEEPNYLAIYPCSNPEIRDELGPHLTTAGLKRRAIRQCVEQGLEQYGRDLPHSFGMSDDDLKNVDLITSAMLEAKLDYPDKRFFVISTNRRRHVKMEILPPHKDEEKLRAAEDDWYG
ncbi:hypothetical protein [Maricaulis maris]|uniref:Uncharacterized protein n=1 Tax=Maricaulis maris TaxID=74318 RepID=A0A495D0U4_9PROT|nr:hypothetical protein [Maricaulis maris]RKQ95134.1 hypothetical protein C7435_2821 [Maricaulis maris]